MHDMRKKALTESLKTTSRRARRRPDSLTGSNNSSRQASRPASNANSRAGSRYASEDEDGSLSSAVGKLRLAGHSPAKAPRKNRYVGEESDDEDDSDSDDSDSEDEDDVMEELSDTELANNAILWQANFNNVIAILEDPKRANLQERTGALNKYGRLLRAIYSSEAIASALPSIMEQLIKSIRKGNSGPSGEKQLALVDLSLTVLSCSSDFDAIDAYEQAFPLVKRLVQDPNADESDKVVALQTMTILVVVGSGMASTINELLHFLLNIVESDGDSVDAPDNGPVVTTAIQMWAFVSSFLVPEEPQPGDDDYSDDGEDADTEDDDEDEYSSSSQDGIPNRKRGGKRGGTKVAKAAPEPEEDGDESASSDFDPDAEDGGEGYFELQGQRAMNAFMEQLESTDSGVQTSSANAIALVFEASRKQQAITGRPLQLQQEPATVADQLKNLGNMRSVKSVKRQDRRDVKDLLRQVTISLEYGSGPDYSPHSHKPGRAAGQTPSGLKSSGFLDDEKGHDTPAAQKDTTIDETAYRRRLVIGDKAMPITTWATSVRVDTLRAFLGNGMPVHLLLNPKVRNFVSAKRLRRIKASSIKEKEKKRRVKKATKKTSGGKGGKARKGRE